MLRRKKEAAPIKSAESEQASKEVLFPEEMEKDFDKMWEATHEYDRYEIDTLILNSQQDIEDVDPTNDSDNDMSSERERKARELLELLKERYKELDGKIEEENNTFGSHGESPIMIMRVLKEWKERYFRFRVERVNTKVYDEWVVALAVYSGLDDKRVHVEDHENNGPLYRAISPIKMVPLDGADAIEIIAPPEIEVSGDPGHSNVYRWDDIDKEIPRDLLISLFPSTRRMLVDRLGLNQYKDKPIADEMNDTEADLAKAA